MNHTVDTDAIATSYETRVDLLRRARRRGTPVRRDFVQRPMGSVSRHGALSTFVRNGDHRGLLAYLFILGVTSAPNEDGWTTRRDSRVWARAFNTTRDTSSTAAALGAVSKILGRLEERRLITTKRAGRYEVSVTLLREDGSGRSYTHPGEGEEDKGVGYIQLPRDFWLDELDSKLKLPGLAMLLVLMTLPEWTSVPAERFPDWYGWSADTAERGYQELRKHDLVEAREHTRKAPAAPLGYTITWQYKLGFPFRHAPQGKKGRPGADPADGREVGDALEEVDSSVA